ncbi:MAG: hypothetical protein V5A44_11775 [Haloarculaceae archaeon]
MPDGENRVPKALVGLYAVQCDPRRRRVLTAAALAAGLGFATLHWGGLLVGGALVGLAQPTLRRALLAGFGFGVAALVVAAVRFALAGTLAGVVGTWPLVAVGVAAALIAGPLGASARGLVPDAA